MTKTSAKNELRQKSEAYKVSIKKLDKAYSHLNEYKGYLSDFYGEKWQLNDLTKADFDCLKAYNRKVGLALVEKDRNENEYYIFVAELLSCKRK